jgi:hypothetical protein
MTTKGSAAERRRIYIHCRPIFSGANAQVRKLQRLRGLVDASWASLEPSLRDIGQKRVLRILQSLLDGGIFESEARAKLEFPDLFLPSSHVDLQREASENSAAKSREEVLDSISSRHDEGLDMDEAPDSEPDEHTELANLVNGGRQVGSPART